MTTHTGGMLRVNDDPFLARLGAYAHMLRWHDVGAGVRWRIVLDPDQGWYAEAEGGDRLRRLWYRTEWRAETAAIRMAQIMKEKLLCPVSDSK